MPVTKRQRLTDLALAQQLAREGKHEAARALFAKYGISYHYNLFN